MHRLISLPRSSRAIICTVLLLLLDFVAPDNTWDTIPTLFNSTLSCTRGSDKTDHILDCKKELPKGLLAVLVVKRLFYGATPTSSNCDRTAPFINCCQRISSKPDCVFESNFKLDQAVSTCSGKSACRFAGRLVSSSMGNCNTTLYPKYTSFSFIEYECISLSKLDNLCSVDKIVQEAPQLFLDSNHLHSNFDLKFTSCNCILFTRCGASVVFEALYVLFKKVNVTECVEEITFQDMKDSSVNKTYNCAENEELSNVNMFNSSSNAAMMTLDILDKHIGSVLISVTSSDPSSVVSLRCGHQVSTNTLPSKYYCPGEDTPPPPPSTTDSINEGGSGDAQGGNQGGNQGTVIIKESNDFGAGGIAGISLAAVAFLLVLSQVLLFLFRRRKKQNSRPDEFVVRYNNHIMPDYVPDEHEYSPPLDHPYAHANECFDDVDEAKYQTVVLPDEEDDYVDVRDEAKYSGDPPPYTEHNED